MVVAVPNPSPMAGGGGVDAAIHLALEEAKAKGLKGRDVTPFVLASVNETTGGQSLKSNVALVRATVGAGAYSIITCFVFLSLLLFWRDGWQYCHPGATNPLRSAKMTPTLSPIK